MNAAAHPQSLARRLAAASLALACLICAAGAHAEDVELRMLKQQVEELKDTVRQLRERIDALEKNDPAAWLPATTAPADNRPLTTPQAAAPAGDGAPPTVAVAREPARSAPAANASVDDKVVLLRSSWQRIARGMEQSAVTDTLGPPSRNMLINGKVVWYYYYAGLGAGSVFFNADGRVSSSQSPNLGWGF